MSIDRAKIEELAEGQDPADILEGIDPDWTDHFLCAEDAIDFYKQWGYDSYAQAVMEGAN